MTGRERSRDRTGSRPTLAVTGANGFLGRHLCRYFLDEGWSVRALVRSVEPPLPLVVGVDAFRCRLPDDVDPRGLAGADALIHCAYATRPTSPEEARRVNEEGTSRLRAMCREAGVGKFVFVSSTSAHEAARSYYGRSKLAVEQRLDATRDLIIRPGLVLGPDGGLFQRLTGALRKLGVVPLIGGGGRPVQTVHVDDLCRAFGRALERGLSGLFVVAEPDALSMSQLFRLVARKLNRRCLLVPVPAKPMLWILRATETLGVRLPLSSENVLGALSLVYQPSQRDLDAIGVELRSASESLDALLRLAPKAGAL